MLQQFAHPIGAKVLELAAFREKGNKPRLKNYSNPSIYT